jgi:hypothetical protein
MNRNKNKTTPKKNSIGTIAHSSKINKTVPTKPKLMAGREKQGREGGREGGDKAYRRRRSPARFRE